MRVREGFVLFFIIMFITACASNSSVYKKPKTKKKKCDCPSVGFIYMGAENEINSWKI